MRRLSLAILSILLLALPVLALGILKIEVPSKATVGEEVTIRVVDSLTGDPVEGATVYINCVEVGTTNENGEITYTFDSPGIYVIGATKFGYTPAVSVSLSVEAKTIETPTPAETPELESYSGLVFTPSIVSEYVGYENFGPLKIQDLINKAKLAKPVNPVAFFTDGKHYFILYGDFEIDNSGYYRIEGYILQHAVRFDGKTWTLFDVVNIEKLNPVTVSVEDLVSNPINYAGKEIIVTGPFREVALNVSYKSVRGITVCIGSISTTPINPKEFTRELVELGKEIIKNPDESTIENITKFAGVSTFRIGQEFEYWKAVKATVQGLVIPADIADLVFPEEISQYLSKRGVIVLIERLNIPAENVSIEELKQNPEKYYGKIVEISNVLTFAKDISVKDLISTVYPPAQSVPVDVYFEPNVIFHIPPKSFLLGFGITGFRQNYLGSIENPIIDHFYNVKGVIVSAKMLNESLPPEPTIIIFEREIAHVNISYPIQGELRNTVMGKFDMLREILGYHIAKLSKQSIIEEHPKEKLTSAETTPTPMKEEKHTSTKTPEEQPEKTITAPKEIKTPGFEIVAGLLALCVGTSIGRK